MFLISRTQNEATSNSTCLICFLTRHSCHEVFHGCSIQIQTTTMHTSLSTFAFPQQLILIFYIFKIFIIWLSTVILILQGWVQRRTELLGKKKTKLASRGIVKQTFVPSSVTPGEMCLGQIWLDCMPCGREAAEQNSQPYSALHIYRDKKRKQLCMEQWKLLVKQPSFS